MVLWRLVAALLLASPAAATSLEIEAPPALASAAARLGTLASVDDFADVLTLLGRQQFGPPITVRLAPEDSELARRTPSWVSGFARPAHNEIVLFPARVPSYPDRNLAILLRHEVTHILTARAVGHRPIPTWLAEGIATVAAREWGLEDRARYAAAVIGPGPRSLRQLEEAFLRGRGQVARAYALSAALVRTLQRRHGPDTVARLLGRIAAGDDLSGAFRVATGTSLADFERRFFGADAFWTTWVPFVTSSGALWMVITLLALVAIRRRRKRDAELRARWLAEELALATPSPPSADDLPSDHPHRYH